MFAGAAKAVPEGVSGKIRRDNRRFGTRTLPKIWAGDCFLGNCILDKAMNDSASLGPRDRPVIEITSEMVEAGVAALDRSSIVDGDYVSLPPSFRAELVSLILRAAISR